MTESSAVYRRRRIIAIVAAAVVAALIVFAITQLTGSNAAVPAKAGSGPRAQAKPKPKPKPPVQLPRGGRTILPAFRVVAYYGAPQDKELGVLGIGSPAQMTKK